MVDYHRAIADALNVIVEDPVFRTGSGRWDSTLTIALYALLLASAWNVMTTLTPLYFKARDKHDKPRWKVIYGLLFFAFMSFVVVNVLRWEHRHLKLAEFATVQSWHDMNDLFRKECPGRSAHRRNDLEVLRVQACLREAACICHAPNSMAAAGLDSKRIGVGLLQASRRRKPQELLDAAVVYGLSGLVAQRFCQVLVLVSASRYLHRACYWHHLSLSAVQALFMALVLLEPSQIAQARPRRFVKPSFVAAIASLQTVTLWLLPTILGRLDSAGSSTKEARESTFALGQGLLLLASLTSPLNCNFDFALGSHPLSVDCVRERSRAKVVGWSWATVGCLSLLLHIQSLWQCFMEASPGRLWRWTHFAMLQPWHDAQYNVLKDSTWRVFGILGDHPWINALGWDVVFSAAGVVVSSVTCHNNPREMLQCSLMPWLDDALVAAERVAEIVQDAAAEGFSKGQKIVDQAQMMARMSLVTGLDKAERLISESHVDFADGVEAKVRGLKELVDAQGRTIDDDGFALRKLRSQQGRGRRVARSSNGEAQPGRSTGRSLRSARGRSSSSMSAHRQARRTSSALTNDASGISEQGGLAYALFLAGDLRLANAAVFGADFM